MNILMPASLHIVPVVCKYILLFPCNFCQEQMRRLKPCRLQSFYTVHKLHRTMLHSTLQCFPGPLLVSTLAL